MITRLAITPLLLASTVLADFEPLVEAPMPDGFPAPGPVGAIVLKEYPAYRMARAKRGPWAFGTLFNHIKRNEIAMTAPVEMTLDDESNATRDMAFLYARPQLGPTGTQGRVDVIDIDAVHTLSYGLRGPLTTEQIGAARAAIEKRLAKHEDLRRAGDWRLMGYNSPMVRPDRRFYEIQLPVKTTHASKEKEMNTFGRITATLALLAGTTLAAENDIVTTAVEAGKFKTLAAALTEAGLVEALQGKGPFTVFAPTDDAFKKLPKGTVANLLKPENRRQLQAILTYHVVPGRVMAKDVAGLTGAKTLNGQMIAIDTSTGVRIDKANVVAADISCSNGVIHVIDTVILPESHDIVEIAAKAGKFETLLAAAKAAGLVEVLQGDGPLTVFAPTDAAFAKLPEGTVAMLLKPENKGKLAKILAYHVVSGRVYAADALAARNADTLAGQSLAIAVKGGAPYAGNAKIIATDIDASNGVIHIIDSVLLPTQGS